MSNRMHGRTSAALVAREEAATGVGMREACAGEEGRGEKGAGAERWDQHKQTSYDHHRL